MHAISLVNMISIEELIFLLELSVNFYLQKKKKMISKFLLSFINLFISDLKYIKSNIKYNSNSFQNFISGNYLVIIIVIVIALN